jgi:hypothetical protein
VKVISKPTSKIFSHNDPDGDWSVGFRQMREGEFIELGDISGKRDVLYDSDGQFIGYRVVSNDRRLLRKGIYLTMTSCDLHYSDGTLVFESKKNSVADAMTERQFNENWDLLDQATADAIVADFNEVNESEGESKATSTSSETPAESG